MPVFTAAAAAIAGALSITSTFVTGAIAFGLQAAASIGLNYAAKALAGNKDEPAAARADHFSAQGTLQSGGAIPRSFNLGYSMTAGSLVYANTWGQDGETPNAYFTQVIALADLPGGSLAQIWVNGQLCSVDPVPGEYGYGVLEYRKDGKDHVWIKYYNGTQTTADAFLQTRVATAERPWGNNRVGYGIAYVICTALVEDTLFTGFPTYKFAVTGLPLYDPSKDVSIGGTHSYSDSSTWGGDGDNLPAVQMYNVLRGIKFGGGWLYGLQSMTAARLPLENWVAQINKCRDAIPTAAGGVRPTYQSGLQINVDTQPANAIETLLTACQGRLSEIGGFYKVHLGAPDSPTFSFTDADILSTEAQNFTPFFPLADSVNGITATYPNPEEGWSQRAAPPLYRDDLEARDGDRRLLANPSFDAVWDSEQVQQLMKSALEEAQRARRHAMVMPPAFWLVEPGDVGQWSSNRNGYIDKLFRVDGVVDEPNLDVSWNITEIDPSDYDWNSGEFKPVYSGPTTFPRPAPQGVLDPFVEPWILKDEQGLSRRPAIRLSYNGDMPGVRGLAFTVRLAEDNSTVHQGSVPELAFSVGATIISQGLLPNTAYQVQCQYVPSSPRDVIPSGWLNVTTPNVLLGIADLDAAIVGIVTETFGFVSDNLDRLEQRLSRLVSQVTSRTQLDKKEVRSQLSATAGKALAQIDEIRTVAVDAEAAVAALEVSVNAQFDGVNATVTQNTNAIATLDGYAAGTWGVAIDINGNVTGIVLANDSENFSVFSVTANNFRVAFPGATGGAAIPVFQISNVGGVPKIVFRGDMIGDGSILTQNIAAGAITTVKLDAQAVTAAKIAAGSITSDSGVIGALGVKSLSIGDNAVTVPAIHTTPRSSAGGSRLDMTGSPQVVEYISMSVDTTGLAGKPITAIFSYVAAQFIFQSDIVSDIYVRVNGGSWGASLQGSSGAFMACMPLIGAITFTGTGGTVTVEAKVEAYLTGAGNGYILTSNIWGLSGKR